MHQVSTGWEIGLLLVFLATASAGAASPPLPRRNVARHDTKNGLAVVVEEAPAAKLVNFSLLVKTGSTTEGRLLGSGITHLLEHLIFKGEPEKNLASAVENAGGYTNAHTSFDHTLFTVTVPAENWEPALRALLKAVFTPSFTEEDFIKEREVVLRELARYEDQPEYHASRGLWATAYLVHPYRLPVTGYPELLAKITYADVKGYHAAAYSPDNAILAAAGPVPAARMEAVVSDAVSSVGRSFSWPADVAVEPFQASPREEREAFPTKLAYLYLGYHIPEVSHPDAVPLDLLSSVLGGGKSSRFYRAIVETGLAYSASAYSYTPRYPGLFILSAVCKPEKVEDVRRVLLREAGKVKDGVSRAELEQARNGVRAQSIFALETVEDRAGDLAMNLHLTGNALYSLDYLAAVAAATEGQVVGAARKYLVEKGMTFSLVTEGAKDAAGGMAAAGAGETRRESLRNGIPVLIREDAGLPMVSFSVLMKGGALFERKETDGLFPLMAELITCGTRRLSSRQIADKVAFWGGSLGPYSGNNSYGLTLTVPSQFWKEGLALLADIVKEPVFPEDEVARQKEEALASVVSRDEQAGGVAGRVLRAKVFGEHPYGLPDGGTKESIAAIDRKLLRETYRRFLGSGNMVVTAFGAVTAREVLAELDAAFGSLGPAAPGESKPFLPASVRAQVARESIDKKEAVVLIGYPGISVSDGRRADLEVFAALMNQQDGTLFDRLREREPLVYASQFSYFLGLQPGMLVFSAQCRPEKIDRVREVIGEVIADCVGKPLPADELERVKTKVFGHRRISRQTLSSQALDTGLSELYGLGSDYDAQLEKEILAVTPASLQALAKEFLQPSKQVTVIVAPK